MSREQTWINNDGLEVGFGSRTVRNDEGAAIHTKGDISQATLVLFYSDLPGEGATLNKNCSIPAGSTILSATLSANDAFSGAMDFGLKEADGTEIDFNGLVAAATPAANTSVVGAGLLLGTQITVDGYISSTGTITTGTGTLIVEYQLPSSAFEI